ARFASDDCEHGEDEGDSENHCQNHERLGGNKGTGPILKKSPEFHFTPLVRRTTSAISTIPDRPLRSTTSYKSPCLVKRRKYISVSVSVKNSLMTLGAEVDNLTRRVAGCIGTCCPSNNSKSAIRSPPIDPKSASGAEICLTRTRTRTRSVPCTN